MTRDDLLLQILRRERIRNEAGEHVIDFTMRQRDSRDFFSMGRAQLERMLIAAFSAGYSGGRRECASPRVNEGESP